MRNEWDRENTDACFRVASTICNYLPTIIQLCDSGQSQNIAFCMTFFLPFRNSITLYENAALEPFMRLFIDNQALLSKWLYLSVTFIIDEEKAMSRDSKTEAYFDPTVRDTYLLDVENVLMMVLLNSGLSIRDHPHWIPLVSSLWLRNGSVDVLDAPRVAPVLLALHVQYRVQDAAAVSSITKIINDIENRDTITVVLLNMTRTILNGDSTYPFTTVCSFLAVIDLSEPEVREHYLMRGLMPAFCQAFRQFFTLFERLSPDTSLTDVEPFYQVDVAEYFVTFCLFGAQLISMDPPVILPQCRGTLIPLLADIIKLDSTRPLANNFRHQCASLIRTISTSAVYYSGRRYIYQDVMKHCSSRIFRSCGEICIAWDHLVRVVSSQIISRQQFFEEGSTIYCFYVDVRTFLAHTDITDLITHLFVAVPPEHSPY
jgi:hypothetical protein